MVGEETDDVAHGSAVRDESARRVRKDAGQSGKRPVPLAFFSEVVSTFEGHPDQGHEYHVVHENGNDFNF
jgi:hypothetical protein